MRKESGGHFQISLMNVFRQAADSGDAHEHDVAYEDSTDRVLSSRSIERREGAGEARLRDHLAEDLANLMSTIHLDAALDLAGHEHVRRSVLNYGMQDMTRHTTDSIRDVRMMQELRAALLAHEPRLIAGTLEIRLRRSDEDANQRIAFDVTAEMAAKPVDVPLAFVAEIDVAAGKVSMADLRVRG